MLVVLYCVPTSARVVVRFRKEALERADPTRSIEPRKEADSGFCDKKLPVDSGEFQRGASSGSSEGADGGTQSKQAGINQSCMCAHTCNSP